MKTIPLPDRHHLDSAEGWLGLGDHLSANEELDQITAELRAHPKVLELWLQIYLMAEKWEASVGIPPSGFVMPVTRMFFLKFFLMLTRILIAPFATGRWPTQNWLPPIK